MNGIRNAFFAILTIALGLLTRNLATCFGTMWGGVPADSLFPHVLDTMLHWDYVEGVTVLTLGLATCGLAVACSVRYRLGPCLWLGFGGLFLAMIEVAYFCRRPQPLGFANYGEAGFLLRTLYYLLILGTQLASGLAVGALWRKLDGTGPGPEAPRRPYGRSRRPYDLGFTLIELLVVIAIVAILAAILLPVLARSKRMGYVTDDIAKMKQTYLAENLYENDNEHASSSSLRDLVSVYAPPAVLDSKLDTRAVQAASSWPANVWTTISMDGSEAQVTSANRISFAYLRPFHNRFTRGQTWEEYRGDPRVGMLVDPAVGECVEGCAFDARSPGQPAYNTSAFLVARMDGSIAKRLSPPCRGPSGFTYEQLFLFDDLSCKETTSSGG